MIDSRTVSASLAMLALGVQRAARARHDRRGGRRVRRALPRRAHLLFTVNTLEYLAKGGRIGRAAALAGNLLNVKPILTIRDGEVVPLKKVRGNHKAFAEFRDAVQSRRLDRLAEPEGRDRPRRGARAPRGAARARRARAAERADRDHDDARRGRRHARRPRHGRLLLVRRRRLSATSGPGPILGPGGNLDPNAPGFRRCGPGRVAAAARLPGRPSSSTRSPSRRCPASGVTLGKRLRALGIVTVRDLLLHRPRRYERAVDEIAISQLWGDDEVAIAGEVVDVRTRRIGGRRTIVTARRQGRHRHDRRVVVQPAVAGRQARSPARTCGCAAGSAVTAST